MAIVITNGEHYIHVNEHGKYVKFNNLLNATQFASVHEAISRIKKAPAKTKGYYVYDTFTDKIVWKQFTQEERIEMQENKNVELEIKRTNNGKIKRKKYSQSVRKVIYDKYDGRCQLCGRKILLSDMTLDHHIALSMGGADDVSNLVPTCLPCNRFKSNIAPALFEERIREIFMYQMEKKFSDKWIWCFVKGILEILI